MDFLEALQEHGVETLTEGHHHCSPGWVQLDCPFCGPRSGRYHLGFNPSSFALNCWVCGRLSMSWTLHELTGLPYHECKLIVGQSERRGKIEIKKRGVLKIPDCVGPLLHPHKRYIRSRDFDPKEIKRLWGVKGIGFDWKYNWRIWLPITLGGETVSWTTRSIDPDEVPRYKSAPAEEEAIRAKDLLYGEDYCHRDTVIALEGPTDVWRIGPGSVATLGIGFTPAQVLRLSRYPVRVVCFDRGNKAQSRARQLIRALTGYPGKTYNVVLDSDDPGSSPPEQVNALRNRFLEV